MRHFAIAVYDESGMLIVLAPLYIDESGLCRCAGSTHNIDYQDFIYNSEDRDKVQLAIDIICAELAKRGFGSLVVDKLVETSVTNTLLPTCRSDCGGMSKSVSIELQISNWQGYFDSLGKHVRQNVRTAYNRIRRDGHKVSFAFYSAVGSGKELRDLTARRVLAQCRQLYLKRQEDKYHKSSFASKLWLSFLNYTAQSVPGENGFLSVMWFDGELAAYMEGYLNADRKAIEVPRLAINDKFGWYSPGCVLIAELVKYLLSNTNIKKIDLCRGTEKYKYDMGGGEYCIKKVHVDLSNITRK